MIIHILKIVPVRKVVANSTYEKTTSKIKQWYKRMPWIYFVSLLLFYQTVQGIWNC